MPNILQRVKDVIAGAKRSVADMETSVSELTRDFEDASAEARRLANERHELLMTTLKPGSPEAAQASHRADELQRQIEVAGARRRSVEARLVQARAALRDAGRAVADMEASPVVVTAAARLADAESTVAALKDKLKAAREDAEGLAAERSRISLAAHTGDPEARARLDALHGEIGTSNSEAVSLEAAIREAEGQIEAARADVQATEAALRQKEAAELVAELLGKARHADELLAELTAVLGERQTIIKRIAQTGAFPPGVLNGLLRGHVIAAALRFASLHRHAEIPGAGTGRPLSDADAALNRVAPVTESTAA